MLFQAPFRRTRPPCGALRSIGNGGAGVHKVRAVLTRPFLLGALALSTVLFALMASGRESAEESDYVGVARCAQCHPAEAAAWQGSAHAQALERLSETERKDPRCRQCHTTSPDENDPNLAGVQCEACHGRGRHYATRWVMKDPELRAALYFEMGNAQTCARCHNEMSPNIRPFDFAVKMPLIRHPALPAEPADGGVPASPQGNKPGP